MTVRTTARGCLAALVAAVAVLGAGSAAAAPLAASPRTVDAPERVTFGIGPGGQAYVDKRSFVSFAAPAGAHLLDKVAVYNQSNQPLDLLVYAADASNSKTGALDVRTRTTRNTDMGAWVLLGQAAETGRLATDARSMVRVHVPPQSRTTGIGKVVIPLRVVVPADAVPGDHVAAVVASLVSRGDNPTSQNIELEQRVALRVFMQVAGDLTPRLAVKILKADYLGGSGLGLKGTTRVTYQIRNTGNVRLGALTQVSVTSALGLGTRSVSGSGVDELLPGGAALLTTDVADTPPSIIQHASVTVTAKAALGSRLAKVPVAHDRVRLWAITWQEILLALLILGWLVHRRWRKARRRKGRHVAPDADGVRAKTVAGAAMLGLVALLTVVGPVTRVHAADLGPIQAAPLRGTDSTLFHGYVQDARCPRGTADSYWSVDGPDLPRDQAILAPGNTTGTGPQQFRSASIANLRTVNSGAFSRSGTYVIRFNCVRSPDGKVTDTYQAELVYRAGGTGSFTIRGARLIPAEVLDPQHADAAATGPSGATPGATAPVTRPSRATAAPGSGPTVTPSAGPTHAPAAAGRAADDSSAAGWWFAAAALVPLALGALLLGRRGTS